MSKVMNMTEGKPARLMLRFALPVILTNLGQQLYQIVDAAIVGRGVGVDALAAVGCTDWTYWMVMWSVSAMTYGFATFVSRYFGKNDPDKINKAITMSVYLTLLISAVFTLFGILGARPILTLLGTPTERNILSQAVTYLTVMFSGIIIVGFYNLSGAILRAFGDSKTPLVAMFIAALLNILLDLLFVVVFHWGVFGAAFASVLSQCVAFLFCTFKIFTIKHVRLTRSAWAWDSRLAKEMAAFGIPLAIQYTVIHLGGMIVQSTVNSQGGAFIAGYTAVNKLYGLLECSAISLGAAFTTYASQNYGASNFGRVRRGVNVAMLLAIGTALLLTVTVLPLRSLLPRLFIDMSEVGAADAIRVAAKYLTNMILSLPILYLVYVHRNHLQAIGNSSWSLISGIAEALSRVIMAKLLFGSVGVEIMFYIEPVAWLMAWLLVLLQYYYYPKRLLPIEA
ncbi:MAG: MATE family efflux transporter [Clostridia bacterium]|nr:MATE family efflux transporter [Clostridia bacterium]